MYFARQNGFGTLVERNAWVPQWFARLGAGHYGTNDAVSRYQKMYCEISPPEFPGGRKITAIASPMNR